MDDHENALAALEVLRAIRSLPEQDAFDLFLAAINAAIVQATEAVATGRAPVDSCDWQPASDFFIPE